MLTGLVYGGGHAGAFAFAGVAVAAFLVHEPLAVIMGLRGVRVRDLLLDSARRRLWLLGAAILVLLVLALWLAPARAWRAAVIPAVPALVLVPAFLTGRVKTLAGELLAATAFSAALLPVALSGPADWWSSLAAAGVWLGAVVPAIVAVHAVKVAHKGRPRRRWLVPAAPVLAVVVAGLAVVVAVWLPYPAVRALAVLPSVVVVVVVSGVLPHPRHLKRIGWAVVAANFMTFFLLLVI